MNDSFGTRNDVLRFKDVAGITSELKGSAMTGMGGTALFAVVVLLGQSVPSMIGFGWQ